MIKYAIITDTEKGLCDVGIGTNTEYYKSLGMTELDVTQSEIDMKWYLTEKLQSPEYLARKEIFDKEKRINEIHTELDELDLKRVRAMCEPELRDAEAGETWLEYYNNQIKELRTELNSLEV